MEYRIHEIKLGLSDDKAMIPFKIKKKLGKQGLGIEIGQWRIVKESVDARDKKAIKLVYSVDFETIPKRELTPSPGLRLEAAKRREYELPSSGTEQLSYPPVIVGFGPCGMFAALLLSEMGYCPVVLERGKAIEERECDVKEFWDKGVLNPESNVQFGEGGAGTFSDGKLTTGIKDDRISKVLSEFVAAGGGEELLYKQKPHIGTDVLRGVVVKIRNKILENGGQIHFSEKLESIVFDSGNLTEVISSSGEKIKTNHLILAIGHSARDTFRYINDIGIAMEQKPFSIGVRIEHHQKRINLAQYGTEDDLGLGAASYKLSHHCKNGRGVYTFCMCPGGDVITASSAEGGVVTNGMSNRKRDGVFANSGLLVDVKITDFQSDDPLAGIYFQEKYEKLAFENGGGTYKAPKTTWGEFEDGSKSAMPVINSLPAFVREAYLEAMPSFGRKLSGFNDRGALMTAVETRSSSPVRIKRDESYQGSIKGVYPAGEGAGYAGGIMSAAVDGIRIAEEIIKRYQPIGGK